MSNTGYKLQPNEVQFTLPTPTPDSEHFISCILSKPHVTENDPNPETCRAAILMHGIGGHKNYCYLSKLSRKLSKEQCMYVVRFDFRNCGDSSKTGKTGRTLQDDLDDLTVVYNYLSMGGFEGKKLYVDTLCGHSRGVVDVYNWQLQNKDKFVINLVACAGRFIGHGLPDSIRKKHPDFEKQGGHYIKGFQDGEYKDVWVPFEETKSLGDLNMITVKEISKDTDTLSIYGTKEQIIPLPDAAHYSNALGDRNTLVLIPGADHGYRGVEIIPEDQRESYGKPIAKNGVVDYNPDVAVTIFDWMNRDKMVERFYEKNLYIHKYLPRWKNVGGVNNFRDIGGYNTTDGKVVRFNLIFRSGNLSNLTMDGLNTLKKLGIKKCYSLMQQHENANMKTKFEDSELDDIKDIHILNRLDVSKNNEFRSYLLKPSLHWKYKPECYDKLLEFYMPELRDIFIQLRDDPNTPILVYCALGKDRTGIIVLLLLLLCRVHPLIVVQEYALTTYGITDSMYTLLRNHLKRGGPGIDELNSYFEALKPYKHWTLINEGVDNMLHVCADDIQNTIAIVDTKYGGIEKYLQDYIGLSESDIDIIRNNLVFTP